MNRPMLASLLAAGLLVAPSFAFGQQSTSELPPRTFAEFSGTWVRDDLPANATPVGAFESSTSQVSPPEPTLVITTTPTQITLTRTPPAPYGPDVYRFDGVPTNVGSGHGTLTLAAGSLLLTRKSARSAWNESIATDLLSVSGDVLTIERQYFRIVRPLDGDKVGHIAATNEGEDARVKMVYRRQPAPTQ